MANKIIDDVFPSDDEKEYVVTKKPTEADKPDAKTLAEQKKWKARPLIETKLYSDLMTTDDSEIEYR